MTSRHLDPDRPSRKDRKVWHIYVKPRNGKQKARSSEGAESCTASSCHHSAFNHAGVHKSQLRQRVPARCLVLDCHCSEYIPPKELKV